MAGLPVGQDPTSTTSRSVGEDGETGDAEVRAGGYVYQRKHHVRNKAKGFFGKAAGQPGRQFNRKLIRWKQHEKEGLTRSDDVTNSGEFSGPLESAVNEARPDSGVLGAKQPPLPSTSNSHPHPLPSGPQQRPPPALPSLVAPIDVQAVNDMIHFPQPSRPIPVADAQQTSTQAREDLQNGSPQPAPADDEEMANNTSAVPMENIVLENGIKGEHWANISSDQKPFKCLVYSNGEKCHLGPFKYRYHLAHHMKTRHAVSVPTMKPGPKVVKNKTKKKKRKPVNSKSMNLKVMTNTFKRARKEFWKKNKQWKERAEVAWEKLATEANQEVAPRSCPILLSLMNKEDKLEELIGVKNLGEGVLDLLKLEVLHNLKVLACLVLNAPTSNTRVTKSMRILFLEKDWSKNEEKRKALVTPIVEWHRAKSITDMLIAGKDKWISRYMNLTKELYDMENVTRMDRIEASCDAYRSKFVD